MLWFRSLIFDLLFYGITVIMSIIGLPLLLLPIRFIQYYGMLWGKILVLLLKIVGIRHRVIGEHAQQTVIYAAKHQSAWETIVLYGLLNSPTPVLKHTIRWYPILGLYFMRLNMVPINRGMTIASLRNLKREAERIAKKGHSILIFPQGTRVKIGESRSYFGGTFAIYEMTNLPVVPIALNSGLFWAKNTFRKRPGEIVVEFLEPIPPGLKRKEFMKRLESDIEKASDALVEAEQKKM